MTKEELIYLLEKRLHKICPQITTRPTLVCHDGVEKHSEWSRQFYIPENEGPCGYLKRIFGINCPDWDDRYKEAVSGDGKEGDKILTLHSSSLLSLLCFSNVSADNPLEINGVKYTHVRFEVKSRVFNKPSNIDMVLENKETGQLLFLESKFTEYLTPDNHAFVMKYFEFYQNILPMIEGFPLQMVFPCKYYKQIGIGLKPASKSTLLAHLYMDGIKQCFSHLIGLCQGPYKNSYQWGKSAEKIRFGSILYLLPGDAFKSYADFYSKTIGKIDAAILNDAINQTKGINNLYANRIEILPTVLTYQEIFKGFNLPANVKTYYNL